ncbi:MAG: methyltransferase domain-containing protein [Pseudomonadota bacterium]
MESVFDNFAASFDSKLASLEYRAPELVKDAVLREIGPDAQTDILDLGCGTGLCGPLLRANASRMVGVDLSGKMLAKAQDRKVYDALEKAEFIAFLESVTQPFGAVIAADALCYIGPVEAFAQNTLAALKPGGVFVGSFEADPDDADVTLTNTGRYTHGRPYLARVFNDAGFEAVTLTAETLRFEQGKEVAGWLVSARRPQ